jgi:hypothetical protein
MRHCLLFSVPRPTPPPPLLPTHILKPIGTAPCLSQVQQVGGQCYQEGSTASYLVLTSSERIIQASQENTVKIIAKFIRKEM